MINREMIVNAFYCCKVKDRCSIDCPYWDGKSTFNECMKRLYDDVYSLLKEQEDQEYVEPIQTQTDNSGWFFKCNKCSNPINWKDKFCSMCGKAVKWE